MRRLHILLFVCVSIGCCAGAYAQDPGPWFQVLSGSQLPNVAYPGVVTHQGNAGVGVGRQPWLTSKTATVVFA